MDQHVISAFLLRRFGRTEAGRRVIEVFDKGTGAYATADTEEFLTERDAHSKETEDRIGLIETQAAAAARDLAKAMRQIPPGLYAVVEPGGEARGDGPAVTDEGVAEGMRVLVGRHQVPAPPRVERAALLRFVALMYQRAPALEASILEYGMM